jgi:hypothetical protein
MTARSCFAGACVLALAIPSFVAAGRTGATADPVRATDAAIVLAQYTAGGGGGGPPPQARGGGGGGAGGGGATIRRDFGGGGGGGATIRRDFGGGGGGGATIRRDFGGGGGGGVAVRRGGSAPMVRGGDRPRFSVPDGDGRRWAGRGDVRVREGWRGDRRYETRRYADRWRYRTRPYRGYGYQDYGYYTAPVVAYYGRGSCHRHHWRWRTLRHCHRYAYRWHRHGRWS